MQIAQIPIFQGVGAFLTVKYYNYQLRNLKDSERHIKMLIAVLCFLITARSCRKTEAAVCCNNNIISAA